MPRGGNVDAAQYISANSYHDQSLLQVEFARRPCLTHTTTMPQTTREEVEITALIRGILNGYPGNSAILREYLQNSDDAKASSQASFLGFWDTNLFIASINFYPKVFIIDEQTYRSESILDPSLKEAQGPALIAYNDGVLRPEDWKALRTIHSSSKKTDEELVSMFLFRFISI